MPLTSFPSFDDSKTYAIKGGLLNQLLREIERARRLRVCPPLFMDDGPGGPVISVFPGSGLPPGGVQYQVLQRVDAVNTPGWDWVRAH